ncbi:transcriptional regulator domain-containing protein [Azospirillum thermophilum]|uniref:transcriptional regulator domain-containing protein n=1 Tax=Azospirillum thermophilum TaxID=2202148 RepID=UPI0011B48DF6|nr:DUF6499 domain-containing protein [Azospirillum thermophilum]
MLTFRVERNQTLRASDDIMTAKNDWRTSAAYQYALLMPVSCWAWEFLRRNRKYQADAAAGRRRGPAGEPDRACDWGLHCPGRPGQERR